MKFYNDGAWVLEVSRRNLRALLAKLDDPYSARTLLKVAEGGGDYIAVKAVEDEEHYADRAPGEIATPALDVLVERLTESERALRKILSSRENVGDPRDRAYEKRLLGKIEGVRLAISYVEEMKR